MAHLHRLAVALLLTLLSSHSFALIPTTNGYSLNNTGPYYGTAAAACNIADVTPYVIAQHTAPLTVTSTEVIGGNGCRAIWTRNNTQYYYSGSNYTIGYYTGICPTNSQASGGQCACKSGFEENTAHTACQAVVDPCAVLAGKPAGMKNWEGKASDFYFCDAYATAGGTSVGGGQCVAVASKDISWESPPDSGHWISQGEAKYTGTKATSCSGAGGAGTDPAGSSALGSDGKPPVVPDPNTAAPSPCPAGQAPGEVNGTRICAPIGPDVEAKDVKETVNPDGSKETRSSDTRCRDGKCTTDTTTCTTPSGSTQQTCSTTQVTQGQGSMCAATPGSKACTGNGDGSGGSFTGDCVAGFKADGDDPVLNAMALDQHKRHCEVLRKDQPESQWYDGQKDVAGTSKVTTPGDATVNIGSGNFDQSDALGGGSCSLNKTITVAGASVALPFNQVCDSLAMLGYLGVAVSLLLAARIVARG